MTAAGVVTISDALARFVFANPSRTARGHTSRLAIRGFELALLDPLHKLCQMGAEGFEETLKDRHFS